MLLRVDAEIGTSFGKLVRNIHKNIGIQNIIDKEGFCHGAGVRHPIATRWTIYKKGKR